MKKRRKYHGWILVENGGSGYKDVISVEWHDGENRRVKEMERRGENGCAEAVEWWDKKLGTHIQLQPMLKGSYRVYTEE